MPDLKLGKSGDLDLSAAPSAVICAVLMVVVLAAVGLAVLKLSLIESLVGGLTATVLHYHAELFHQQGHARAAREAGYPMLGVRFWTIFGASIYPPDEPELPAEVHIQRALGGPISSAIMTMVVGLLAFFSREAGGVIWYVFVFDWLDNLLVFTLGSFLPLGFTDGSTLLRWWPKRNKPGA
jgi:hypothetical protein